MSSFVAVMIGNGEYRHFSVPEEIYVYIRQLEECIKHPKASKLRDMYPRLSMRGVRNAKSKDSCCTDGDSAGL